MESTVIIGTGSYIPGIIINDDYFKKNIAYDKKGNPDKTPIEDSLEKFKAITNIHERRYAKDDESTSLIGFYAAQKAIESSGINPESLDYIIFAHNFGDIDAKKLRTDMVPNLATRVKGMLKIENRKTIPKDTPFGCPGWVEALMDSHRYFCGGHGKRALIIGAEILSRVSDPHDRDSRIYSDGAGAVIVERIESVAPIGILGYSVDCGDTTEKVRKKEIHPYEIMKMGETYGPEKERRLYFKMEDGSDVYNYSKKYVPKVLVQCLENSGLSPGDIKKVLLHQANGKMDKEMFLEFLKLSGVNFQRISENNSLIYLAERKNLEEKLNIQISDKLKERYDKKDYYNFKEISSVMLPMIISWLGNNSVASIPIMFDLMARGELIDHKLEKNDAVLFGSIGAGGPNINAIAYRICGNEFPKR